jgi:hypothetical protein
LASAEGVGLQPVTQMGGKADTSPDISCPARKAHIPERRLAVGLGITMMLKAD